jgi:hypothetical protein
MESQRLDRIFENIEIQDWCVTGCASCLNVSASYSRYHVSFGMFRPTSRKGPDQAWDDRGQPRAFSSQLNSKVDNILTKTTGLRITLNIDGSPVVSKSHTHPSDTETSLSLGVTVARETQWMWVV